MAAGPGLVPADDLLPLPLRQERRDSARDHIVGAARRERDDEANRPRRIGLRARATRNHRQRRSAHREMQKGPTGKLHEMPPNDIKSYSNSNALGKGRNFPGRNSGFGPLPPSPASS